MDASEWKKDYKEFERITKEFYAGEVSVPEYKKVSGGFGSYAQRGGKAGMLRLRFPGGQVRRDQLKFVSDSIKKYHIDKVHFTTCQTIQLHNLSADTICELSRAALDCGIVTRGGGGDFPRNVMASPLSGVARGECFDVLPAAKQASDYLLEVIKTVKLPRKLKVCFSNSPANTTHATFRDLGFAARCDGTFDVYSAGGLGNNPRFGVPVARGVEVSKTLYYIKAMIKLFTAYGNYENRARARTRYMQDVLGEKYIEAFHEKLEEALREENMDIIVEKTEITKRPVEVRPESSRAIPQKQLGLYAVEYHPAGGCPAPKKLCEIYDEIKNMEQTELRIGPDETIYIINCNGTEAQRILDITEDGGETLFEKSTACIGASICQIGLRDSQRMLSELINASKKWKFADGVLPQIHISGCPSSCGTHQIGRIGLRGGVKKTEEGIQPAFILSAGGNDTEGEEQFGGQIGAVLESDIPEFFHELGEEISEKGMTFDEWYQQYPDRFREIAEPYIR